MKPHHAPPFSPELIKRVLLVLVVILSMAAGYYHALTQAWQRRYDRLDSRYKQLELQLIDATASAQINPLHSAEEPPTPNSVQDLLE